MAHKLQSLISLIVIFVIYFSYTYGCNEPDVGSNSESDRLSEDELDANSDEEYDNDSYEEDDEENTEEDSGEDLVEDNFTPLWNSLPNVPVSKLHSTCMGWLQFHNFCENFYINRQRAFMRNIYIDLKVHMFAAIYAYYICAIVSDELIENDKYSAEYFCGRIVPHDTAVTYVSLEDAMMTCPNWIYTYGYDNLNTSLNKVIARNRKYDHDRVTHIMVAMYSDYLQKTEIANITPMVFCTQLENTEMNESSELLSFISLNQKKSCKEWIEDAGYTDDCGYNTQKARRQNLNFLEFQSKWTQNYISHILLNGFASTTPELFCYLSNYPKDVYYDRE